MTDSESKQTHAAVKSGRIYFLDNLKSAVILMVIAHHAAMGYMTSKVQGWGIHDVRTSRFFDWFVAWDDAFIMPLMFFISGYFGIASLCRYSTKDYLKGKFFRIGWPWLTGVVFLAPVTYGVAHPELLGNGIGTYLAGFWTTYFYPAQYWYLNVLLWFYILLAAAFRICPRLTARAENPEFPSRVFFPAVTLFGFGGMFLLNLWIPDSAWCPWYLLEIQYVRAPLYALFFVCGAWAWKKRFFQENGYRPNWKIWLFSAAIASAGYFIFRWYIIARGIEFQPVELKLADTSIRACLSVVCSFAAIAVFSRFANRNEGFLAKWSAVAFAVYWIQQPVVTCFAKWTSAAEVNCFLKFSAVSLATAGISYFISAFILLKLPFFAPGKK